MNRSGRAAGVLLVRAWIEGGPDEPRLRARITETRDLTSSEQTVTTSATVDEVCRTVRAWLEELLDQGHPTP
jgi:hypothetical protein